MDRKLKLELDTLSVESFAADAGENARGTVLGHATHYGTCQGSCVQTCTAPGCETHETLYLTCRESCGWTNGVNVCKEIDCTLNRC